MSIIKPSRVYHLYKCTYELCGSALPHQGQMNAGTAKSAKCQKQNFSGGGKTSLQRVIHHLRNVIFHWEWSYTYFGHLLRTYKFFFGI